MLCWAGATCVWPQSNRITLKSGAKIEKTDLQNELNHGKELVNSLLGEYLVPRQEVDEQLQQAMEYVVSGQGKRLRSVLVLWCCELVSGQVNHHAQAAAAAIELVHTYSLVHDDLPAMDDDDMRRGRPTCHKQFDQGTAILVGDGLLTLAFEILGKDISDSDIAITLVAELAGAAGVSGMVSGQMADLRAENANPDRDMLEFIHRNKTAKMFQAAAGMGAISGQANAAQLEALRTYGMKIGLGFQIADDILDVSASSEQLGKTAGKDLQQGKATYPSLVGLAESRQMARQLADQAVAALECFDGRADLLRLLAEALVDRTS